MRISVTVHGQPDGGRTTDAAAVAKGWSVTEPVTLPMATVRSVEIEQPDRDGGDGRLRVEFAGRGDPSADRRFLVEVRAFDAAGRTLLHTWELQPDARLADPQRANRLRLPLPGDVVARLRELRVQLPPWGRPSGTTSRRGRRRSTWR